MVRGINPNVPLPIPPMGKGKGTGAGEGVGETPKTGKHSNIGRGPELDAHAIAVALSVAAKEAKEKELSFEQIIQRVIDMTGISNPQAAMEEANRLIQKEIEKTLDDIKNNKELMEEAEAWEEFGSLLGSQLNEEQIKEFLSMIHKEIT